MPAVHALRRIVPKGAFSFAGVTLTSPDWLRKCVADAGKFEEIYYQHRGWDEHLDVFGFVKLG